MPARTCRVCSICVRRSRAARSPALLTTRKGPMRYSVQSAAEVADASKTMMSALRSTTLILWQRSLVWGSLLYWQPVQEAFLMSRRVVALTILNCSLVLGLVVTAIAQQPQGAAKEGAPKGGKGKGPARP